MFPLPVKHPSPGQKIGTKHTTMRSKSRGPKSSSSNPRPIIDMSSVKPFSQHGGGAGGGGSTAFTRTTAATSSSEESRAAQSTRSARSRHSYHEPRRESRGAHPSGSASVRRRSKSRPRDAASSLSMASSLASSPRSPRSPRGASMSRSNRGRSQSRPREKSSTAARGRSMSIVRKEAQDSSRGRSMSLVRTELPDSRRGKSRPRTEVRGRSLGPESLRGRSQSRSRTALNSSSKSTSSSGTVHASRSRSRARISSIRKSRCESMETMEEEREEDMSDRNLVYQSNSNNRREDALSGSRNDGRRSLSRKRDPAVDVLEAVNAAAATSDRSRGKSLSRNRGDGNAAAAAIAAALNEKKKANQPHVNSKAKSHSFHDTGRKCALEHHIRNDASRRTSQFDRKSSRSVSPLRTKSNTAQRYTSSRPADASVTSLNSSASSNFSAYDRRIAQHLEAAASTAGSRRSSMKNNSSEMALCEKGTDSSNALLNADGCCALHPFIQLKMKLPSGTWKTLAETCVVCYEEENAGRAAVNKISSAASKFHTRRSTESGASRPKVESQERKTRASVAVMELRESGEFSLTPSFLEDDDESKKTREDNSSRGSANSFVEHKTKTSVACSSKASRSDRKSSPRPELPPFEVSFPNKISGFDEEQSLDLSKHSAHTLEQDDVKSVKSSATYRRNHNQDDMKSVRSSATARIHHTKEQDDTKSVKSTATARMKRSSTESNTIDMSLVDAVVEPAMQKIKSMDEIQSIPSKTQPEAVPVVARSNPPPPPTPRSQSSKNLNKSQRKMSSNISVNHNGSSNNSSLQRPPPPPPPPRSQMKNASSIASSMDKAAPSTQVTSPDETLDYGCSMNVLNPNPEPELHNEFGSDFDEMIPPFEQMEVSGAGASANVPQIPSPGIVNAPAKDWMAYCITSSGREGKDQKSGKRRIFGRNSTKHVNNDREIIRSVRQMPYTDQFGDFGLYTGQVNEDGRPDGKGSMKYDNGVFYEGTWTNGCQDQKAASQYGRIRGGFTSWQGRGNAQTKSGSVLPWNARKNDSHDPNKKVHVRGMEWTDLNGDSGRYTGEINADELPHGHGIMKYDFGLVAEGEWSNGVLKENPQDRLMAAATAPPMSSGRPIGAGMSVGPGAQGFSASASVMGSVIGSASVMGGCMPVNAAAAYPMPYGGMNMNPMMMAPQSNFTLMAQQNALMKSQAMGMYGGASVYGGGSVYGGACQVPPVQMQELHGQRGQPAAGNPPISEIKIN